MHTDIHARTSDSSSTARYSSPNQKRRMRQQHLNSVYAVARRNKSCQKIPKTMKFYQTGWSHGANRRVVRYNLPTDMLVFFIIGAEKNRPFADGEKHCAVIPGLYIRGAHKRFLCEAQGSMLYWIGYNIQLHS